MAIIIHGDGQITGLVDTFVWDQTTNNPMTSLTDLTTGSGTWSIDTNVKSVSSTGHCRALSNFHLTAGNVHIVEVEVEIPSTLTSSGQHVRVGFAPSDTGNYITAGIRGDSSAYFEQDNIAALQNTPYTIPSAGTWVKIRLRWDTNANLWQLWLDGVYQSSYSFFQAFSTSLKPYVTSYNSSSQTVRWRNFKSWSLTTHPSTTYPADPA